MATTFDFNNPTGAAAKPKQVSVRKPAATTSTVAPAPAVTSAIAGRANQGTTGAATGGTTAAGPGSTFQSPAASQGPAPTPQSYTTPTSNVTTTYQPTPEQAAAIAGRANQGEAGAAAAGGGSTTGAQGPGATYNNPTQNLIDGQSRKDIVEGYFGSVNGGAKADPNAFNPYGGPGTAEQWYAQNSWQYGQPTQLANYYQGIQGQVAGQRWQPTNMQGAFQGNSQSLQGQGAGTTTAMGAAGQLMNASQGEQAIYGANQYFGQPNLSSNYAQNQLASGYFGSPTDSTNFYQQNAAGLQGMGQGSAAASGIVGGLNYGDQALGMAGGAMNQAQNTQAYNARNQGNYTGTNIAGQAYDDFRPGLNQKSYSEQLYESGNQGLNTFYDREYEKRQKALEDKMAAMGVFGSGATARAMYELQGELGAAQARDMASLAGQADESYRGRAGLSGTLAGAAGDESVSRLGLGLQSATAADQGLRDNTKTMLDAYGMASDEDLARANTYLGIDDRNTARTRLAGDLAAQSDASGLARRTAGSDIATAGDTSRINQGKAIVDMGQAAGSLSNQRLNAAGQLGINADAENRQRAEAYFDQAKGLDQGNLDSAKFTVDNLMKEADLNLAQDTQRRDLRNDQFGAAKDVQGLYQGRYDTAFDQSRLLANDQAKLIAGGTELATGESGKASQEDISLLMDSAGLDRDSARAMAELAASQGIDVMQMVEFVNSQRKTGNSAGAGNTGTAGKK